MNNVWVRVVDIRDSYLIPTDLSIAVNYSRVQPDFKSLLVDGKVQEPNVFAVLQDRNYILAFVDYPNQSTKVYESSFNKVIEVDVRELFSYIQEQAIAWSNW